MANSRVPAGQVPFVKRQGATDLPSSALTDMKDDQVVRMAGAKQPAALTQSKHLPKESLLGYPWRISNDTLSTDKDDGMNLFPACQGLRPDWATLRAPEDLLELHKRQPLRHCHALAAAHGTFDPILSCPWVAAQNKYCFRMLILNTELQTSNKNNKNGTFRSKYNDLLPDSYVKYHLFHMVRANLQCQASLSQPRSWRFPVCVKYSDIVFELDSLSDGCWGALGG